MKIATSYFYQIRNFKKNMIPLSTALWDPAWYHNFTNNYYYIFKDKRGILNGIRLECIINQALLIPKEDIKCPCHNRDYKNCKFLQTYEKVLDNIDFDKLITDLENFAELYQENEDIEDEVTMVLIVYETPNNPCSERAALQNYFRKHGYECNELKYPI